MKKQGVAVDVRSTYTTVTSIGYGGPRTIHIAPHNALYNWVKRKSYPSHNTKNRFAYNTGARVNIVSGKHATSATSHWKPVLNSVTIVVCDHELVKRSFPIVHPQGTHVNITEVSCEKLDLYSNGTHVKFLTQGVTLGIHLSSVGFQISVIG